MKRALLAINILLAGCVEMPDHYPVMRAHVKRDLVLPDFTGVSEAEKREMGLVDGGPKLAPKGTPFDLSKYDGSYEDVQRCVIELYRSPEPIKNPDICYETVSSPELREKYKLYDNRRYIPKAVILLDD